MAIHTIQPTERKNSTIAVADPEEFRNLASRGEVFVAQERIRAIDAENQRSAEAGTRRFNFDFKTYTWTLKSAAQ